MTEFSFVVTVDCETKEQAEQVMAERLGCDEDYGFEYTLDYNGTNDQLGRHLYQHIERGAKTWGTYDPDQIMYMFEEQLTADEYKKIRGFLEWLYDTKKTIGHGNYEEVYAEFRKETGK